MRWRLLVVLAFLFIGCRESSAPEPLVPQPEDDPITRVSVPGAYGVPSGDQILQPSRQTSVLFYDKSFTYRIIDPASQAVVSLSGLPISLKKGAKISLNYRLMKAGCVVENVLYENVEILVKNDNLAWLKKDERIFFVIPVFLSYSGQ